MRPNGEEKCIKNLFTPLCVGAHFLLFRRVPWLRSGEFKQAGQSWKEKQTKPNDTCTCCRSYDWFMDKSSHNNWHLKLYTFLVNYLNSSSKWKHRAKTRGCEPGKAKLLMLQWLKVVCRAWYRDIHSTHHSIVCASVGRACVTLKSSLRYFTVLCNVI